MIINSPISPIAFNIFDYQIYWYGIILMFSIVVGLILTDLFIKKEINKQEASCFIDFSPLLIICSIFGARLFYVIGAYKYYIHSPKEIIMLHHGGISIYGAIIFGILAVIYYIKKNKYDLYKYFDILALIMPLCQALGRWGNYFNQEAFGRPTQNNIIKLFINYSNRPDNLKEFNYFHPTFLYESILNIILFCILLILFKNKNIKTGTIFYLYLIFYGIIRVIVENYRIDSVLNISNIPVATIISILVILISITFLLRLYKK